MIVSGVDVHKEIWISSPVASSVSASAIGATVTATTPIHSMPPAGYTFGGGAPITGSSTDFETRGMLGFTKGGAGTDPIMLPGSGFADQYEPFYFKDPILGPKWWGGIYLTTGGMVGLNWATKGVLGKTPVLKSLLTLAEIFGL